MEAKSRAQLHLVQEVYIPAISEHHQTGKVTKRHPTSGALLKVDRNDAAGYVSVSTDLDGVLCKVRFKPKGR